MACPLCKMTCFLFKGVYPLYEGAYPLYEGAYPLYKAIFHCMRWPSLCVRWLVLCMRWSSRCMRWSALCLRWLVLCIRWPSKQDDINMRRIALCHCWVPCLFYFVASIACHLSVGGGMPWNSWYVNVLYIYIPHMMNATTNMPEIHVYVERRGVFFLPLGVWNLIWVGGQTNVNCVLGYLACKLMTVLTHIGIELLIKVSQW
jgi:hypothetical protein